MLHGDELELSFKLVAEAHVQLIAKRGGHVVAKTPRETLKAGKRKLLLRLNPHRWPNKLALNATAAAPADGHRPGAAASSGGGQSLTAPISAETVST